MLYRTSQPTLNLKMYHPVDRESALMPRVVLQGEPRQAKSIMAAPIFVRVAAAAGTGMRQGNISSPSLRMSGQCSHTPAESSWCTTDSTMDEDSTWKKKGTRTR